MPDVGGILKDLLRKVRTSEWARWGRYGSYVDGYIQRTNFPGFRWEAWRSEVASRGRWKAAREAAVRKELLANASRFTSWWWELPLSHRLASGAGTALVTSFGLSAGSALISTGRRILFSGRAPDYIDHAYNRMEGLTHGSELRSEMRRQTTDFGSGWQVGRTLTHIKDILKHRRLKAVIHRAERGIPGSKRWVWFDRVAKEQTSSVARHWSNIEGMESRARGIIFEFPDLSHIPGVEMNVKGMMGIHRIPRDVPLSFANKVIVPSHPRLWQRIMENAGLGHIKVEQLAARSTGAAGRTIKPHWVPPPATSIQAPSSIAGVRYDEVKAAISGSVQAKKKDAAGRTHRRITRQALKLVPHNGRNITLQMHDQKIMHGVIDDLRKNSHLYDITVK